MRKKRTKKFLIVLVTMLALVLGNSIMTVQASSNAWYEGGNGVQFKRYKIKKGNTILDIKDKALREAIDSRHFYAAESLYTKGNYVYVGKIEEDSYTFGQRTWAVNMATGKLNKFSNSAIGPLIRIYGKYLYYVESVLTSGKDASETFKITFRIIRSNLMGKNKKLLKKITVTGTFPMAVKLTNHKFVYAPNGTLRKKHSIKF